MKLAIFNFNDELSGEGSRLISSVLKKAGHDVVMVFMPFYGKQPIEHIDPKLLDRLAERDLFMISLYSCYEGRAKEITKFLRENYKKPIIWGGVHPTAVPRQSLKYADLIIRGEAESAVVEFCAKYERGEDWRQVDNLAYLDDQGNYVENTLAQLPFELDQIPFPDYDLENQWVLDNEKVVPCDERLLEKYHTVYYHDHPAYFVMTTRGCPFVCTYCYQSQLVNTYPTREYQSRKLRYKSVEGTVAEIKWAVARFPFLRGVGFSDDDFCARPLEQIQEFAVKYKEQVGLPFGMSAIPASITEDKLRPLLEAGCKSIQIGIQSGSDRLNREVYRRYLPKKKVLEALDLLTRYRFEKGFDFRVSCDWIIDCPWETEEDVLESIQFSLEIPRWCQFNIFTLTYYPGTTLYDRALAEGIITEDENPYSQVFNVLNRVNHSYLTHVFLLKHRARRFAPDWLVQFLTSKGTRAIGERLPRGLVNRVWGDWLFPKIAAIARADGITGSGAV